MLRDIRVPWYMIVPLTLACVLLFTFVPTALATSTVHAQWLGNGQPLRYLALGDSLAAGLRSGGHPHHPESITAAAGSREVDHRAALPSQRRCVHVAVKRA